MTGDEKRPVLCTAPGRRGGRGPLFVGILLPLLLSGCHGGKDPARARPHAVTLPVVSPSKVGTLREIEVAGVVRGIHEALLTARVGGQVEVLPVRLGQGVTKGELLLGLSSQSALARKERSEAALSYARANFARIDRLFRDGSASRAEWDRAKQSLDVAVAGEREAVAALSWTRVTAPFSGRISQKQVRKGDVVLSGSPLMVVVDTSRLLVVGFVPDAFSAALKPGLAVRFSVKGNDLAGRIRDLSPQSDPVTHTVAVKVLLERASVARTWPGRTQRDGAYGKLFIPVFRQRTMTLPSGAVVDHEGLREVFVVKDGHAELRYVRTGKTMNGRVEILSGLSTKALVVAAPPAGLTDGMPVSGVPLR